MMLKKEMSTVNIMKWKKKLFVTVKHLTAQRHIHAALIKFTFYSKMEGRAEREGAVVKHSQLIFA